MSVESDNMLIKVLLMMLELCYSMASIRKKNTAAERVILIDDKGREIILPDKQFADIIFDSVYQQCKNTTNSDEMLRVKMLFVKGAQTQCKEIELQKNFKYIDYLPMNCMKHTEQLEESLRQLENEIIIDEQKKELSTKVGWLIQLRRDIVELDTPFLRYDIIERYLNVYYDILNYLLTNMELMTISSVIQDMLYILLSLDVDKGKVSLLAPMALNATRKMYLEVEEYFLRMYEKIHENDYVLLSQFDKSVIEKKVRHAYRWYFYSRETGMSHIAIPPYKANNNDELEYKEKLFIPCRQLEKYNSYEGIGEMRVAEKILFEMQESPQSTYCVALLGDINEEPVLQLAQYVHNILEMQEKDVLITYNLYSKNFVNAYACTDKESNSEICYHAELDEVFMTTKCLKEVLEQNQIVFFMDCMKLYEPLDAEITNNIELEKQKYILGTPFDRGTIDRIDLSKQNLMDTLYEGMMVYAWKGKYGYLKKRANNALLQICENTINELHEKKQQHHSLYVYVSDLSAFYNLYCINRYCVRTERYNQKEIGIIRYTDNNKHLLLPVKESNGKDNAIKMISFNVWQVIKHICLERRKDILKILNYKIYDYELRGLYIGIDYTQWPNKLLLHYAIDEGKEKRQLYEEFLKKFLKSIVIPMLNEKDNNLFKQYFWRAVKSFLYGDAKNVQDMLFIHLYEKGSTGNFVLAEENKPDIVIENVNKKFKYSIKRFYERIMDDYDISAVNSFIQSQTALEVDISDNNIGGKKRLFENVIEVCKDLNYEQSYLYVNCKRLLDTK